MHIIRLKKVFRNPVKPLYNSNGHFPVISLLNSILKDVWKPNHDCICYSKT